MTDIKKISSSIAVSGASQEQVPAVESSATELAEAIFSRISSIGASRDAPSSQKSAFAKEVFAQLSDKKITPISGAITAPSAATAVVDEALQKPASSQVMTTVVAQSMLPSSNGPPSKDLSGLSIAIFSKLSDKKIASSGIALSEPSKHMHGWAAEVFGKVSAQQAASARVQRAISQKLPAQDVFAAGVFGQIEDQKFSHESMTEHHNGTSPEVSKFAQQVFTSVKNKQASESELGSWAQICEKVFLVALGCFGCYVLGRNLWERYQQYPESKIEQQAPVALSAVEDSSEQKSAEIAPANTDNTVAQEIVAVEAERPEVIKHNGIPFYLNHQKMSEEKIGQLKNLLMLMRQSPQLRGAVITLLHHTICGDAQAKSAAEIDEAVVYTKKFKNREF